MEVLRLEFSDKEVFLSYLTQKKNWHSRVAGGKGLGPKSSPI